MKDNNMNNSYDKRLVKEDKVPGLDVTKKANKETEKENKSYYKEVTKKMSDYDKPLSKKSKDSEPVKFNYNSNTEEDYHREMEIMNGQEMIQYDREPNDKFKSRALAAIEGSPEMGNDSNWANVIPKQKGFTGPDFGKELVKHISASEKKRSDQTPTTKMFGDDWEVTKDKSHKPYAFESVNEGKRSDKQYNKEVEAYKYFILNTETNNVDSGWEYEGDAKDALRDFDGDKKYVIKTLAGLKKMGIDNPKEKWTNKDKNKSQIKEGMKRLRFKKPFNGHNNALKMIPENYRVDNKTFEMTDGNETYQIRWEGSLNEGKGVILTASNKMLVNEEVTKIKHLMGYKPEKTLGTLKGNQRIDENKIFENIWDRTKRESLSLGDDYENESNVEEGYTGVNSGSDIKKYVMFCFNFPYNFISDIWGGTHLENHFKSKFNGDVNKFYANLDEGNRAKLEAYILNKPDGSVAESVYEMDVNEGDVENAINYMNGNEQLKAKLKTLNSSAEIIDFVSKFVKALTKGDDTLDSKISRAIKGDETDQIKQTDSVETQVTERDRFDEVFEGLDEEDMDEGFGNVLGNIKR